MKRAILLWMCLLPAALPAEGEDVVFKAMGHEMERSIKKLKLDDLEKPYFIAYRVDEQRTTMLSGTLGVVTSENTDHSRVLFTDVRVGDYAFDNTNFLSVGSMQMRFARSGVRGLTLDDDYDELRRDLWLATDDAYKDAATQLNAKRSVLQHRKVENKLPDFTPHPPTKYEEPQPQITGDAEQLRKIVREVSGAFRGAQQIFNSGVTVMWRDVYTRFLNSEGTKFTRAEPRVLVTVRAQVYGANGAPVSDAIEIYGRTPGDLEVAGLVKQAQAMAAHLTALARAKPAERYSGPVLFEEQAAGEVVAQVLAPALTAFRFPLTDQPQFETAYQQMAQQFGGASLAEKLGARVMPDFLDLSDVPQPEASLGKELLGSRMIDDDGVRTQRVDLVKGGILKALLSTRVPTAETNSSTGSKRFFGATPSNLVLSARKAMSLADLRKELLRISTERGNEYALIVRRVGGGGLNWMFRMAGSMGQMGGASNTSAIHVVKLFPDGREELVQGAELELLTPAAFRNIVAVGDKPYIYNGGYVPGFAAIFSGAAGRFQGEAMNVVSYVVPPILLEEMSAKLATTAAPNPPIAPSPLAAVQTQ